MSDRAYQVRMAIPAELGAVGDLMVHVYSHLKGFPTPAAQPNYYKMLKNVGDLLSKPGTEILVAASPEGKIDGAVVYFDEMQYYGSGGTATSEVNAAGFRLLAVNPERRGLGIGKRLVLTCIAKAKEKKRGQVIIHSTEAMTTAWKMYEGMGFRRSEDLDFRQGDLPVFGFRLKL